MNIAEWANKQGACEDGLEWIGDRDAEAAWRECPRGDWMIWAAAKVGVQRRALVLAACACARLVLPYVRKGEERPLKAIETTEAWCRGEATIEQVRCARTFAAAAYADAAAAYAAYAADDAYAAARAAARAAAAYAYAEATWLESRKKQAAMLLRLMREA